MYSIFSLLTAALAIVPCSSALPAQGDLRERALPAYFILAGDSTTAKNGGWGDGFLGNTLTDGASGKNLGHGGATTASFREGGDWAKVLQEIEAQKDKYHVFVTIQFGHNDQKEGSGVSLSQFTTNLKRFSNEARAAGATPILVSSLTRRKFDKSSPPKVIENLANERAQALVAAQETSSRFIDLNKASTTYVNAIGQEEAQKYNREADDTTHLNAHAGVVFGRLVSDLLVAKYADVKAYTKENAKLSALIAQGKPA